MTGELLGFVGIARMGHPMTRRLLAAGYRFIVMVRRVIDLPTSGPKTLTIVDGAMAQCPVNYIDAPVSDAVAVRTL